jgi:adenylyltransferase/sulfurtransferase
MSASLDAEQLDRYARQVVMGEVGPAGQQRLLDGSALVVGAGGLGAPVLQYLGAAGVGTIGVVDDDAVERSNLQRQVVHGDDDVGLREVASARDFGAALNPDVCVETHQTALTAANASALVSDYDVVVDATDNFRSRFLVNDACVLADVPFVHGAVFKFEGQVTTFDGGGAPCYRCLFPEAPPADAVPSCAEAGVLGAVPGTVGTMQATEALKLLLGAGDSLAGRLLCYDAMGLGFDEVTVRADSSCPVCGDDPAIESVREVEYEGSCAV